MFRGHSCHWYFTKLFGCTMCEKNPLFSMLGVVHTAPEMGRDSARPINSGYMTINQKVVE